MFAEVLLRDRRIVHMRSVGIIRKVLCVACGHIAFLTEISFEENYQ